MSQSSILGGRAAPKQPDGSDVDRLGPSDSSDSGSDVQGEQPMATSPDRADEWGALPAQRGSDSDALGTGERAVAGGRAPRDSGDIMPDHVIGDGRSARDRDQLQAQVDSLADDDDAAPDAVDEDENREHGALPEQRDRR